MTTAREARHTIAGQLRSAANGALIGVQLDVALAHTIADLLDSCLSCEAPAGRPHTDYCRRPNRDYPGQPGERAHDCGDSDRMPVDQAPHLSDLDHPDHGCTCNTASVCYTHGVGL